jgi:hypothetical protein
LYEYWERKNGATVKLTALESIGVKTNGAVDGNTGMRCLHKHTLSPAHAECASCAPISSGPLQRGKRMALGSRIGQSYVNVRENSECCVDFRFDSLCSTASDFRVLIRQRLRELTRLVGISKSGSAFLIEVFGRLHLALASRRVCIQAKLAVAVKAFVLHVLCGLQQHLIRPRGFGEQWTWIFTGCVLLVVFFARCRRTRQWERTLGLTHGRRGYLFEMVSQVRMDKEPASIHTTGSWVSLVERYGNDASSSKLRFPEGISDASALRLSLYSRAFSIKRLTFT